MNELVIDFNWPQDFTKESFVINQINDSILHWICSSQNWPNRQLVLIGPRHSGKTHLASICNSSTTEEGRAIDKIIIDELPNLAEDDVIQILNHAEMSEVRVLWCTQVHPKNLNYSQYVQTRLSSNLILEIPEPCEELFRGIIAKRCKDYGLVLTQDCLDYISNQIPITFKSAYDFILKLHQACLENQKQPSVQFISQIIS